MLLLIEIQIANITSWNVQTSLDFYVKNVTRNKKLCNQTCFTNIVQCAFFNFCQFLFGSPRNLKNYAVGVLHQGGTTLAEMA